MDSWRQHPVRTAIAFIVVGVLPWLGTVWPLFSHKTLFELFTGEGAQMSLALVVSTAISTAALLGIGAIWYNRTRPLALFDGNTVLGSFENEIAASEVVWGVWPAGTTLLTQPENVLRKLRRVILCSPAAAESYAPMLMAVNSESLVRDIRRVTTRLSECGTEVRWHPNPTVALLISDAHGESGWVRMQPLTPYTASSRRPSIRATRKSPIFAETLQAFERLWQTSQPPS